MVHSSALVPLLELRSSPLIDHQAPTPTLPNGSSVLSASPGPSGYLLVQDLDTAQDLSICSSDSTVVSVQPPPKEVLGYDVHGVSGNDSSAGSVPPANIPGLPNAYSTLASFGIGLCNATTVSSNETTTPSFGKISPIYGNGATGSRGGTPDIPQPSNLCVNGSKSNGINYANGSSNSTYNNSLSTKYLTHASLPSPTQEDNGKLIVSSPVSSPNAKNGGSGGTFSSTHLLAQANAERQTYNCKLCGKPFGQPYNLRRHMSTHTGVRPFQCPYCDYAASQNVHLDKHIRRIHPNVPANDRNLNGSANVNTLGMHVSSNGSNGIKLNGNGIAMNAGGTGNGILKVESASSLSPKTMGINPPWKFESTAVTP